jgi:hypothetical protein
VVAAVLLAGVVALGISSKRAVPSFGWHLIVVD